VARVRGGWSLRTRLALLVAATAFPLLAFGLGLNYADYVSAREDAGKAALGLARGTSLALEGRLRTWIAAMQALSLSPYLRDLDMANFRDRAEALLAQQFPDAAIVLLRQDGQQLMNTAVSPDTPLPVIQNKDALRQVFATGQPVVSDLYPGQVVNRPIIAIEVPVKRGDGTVAYALALGPPLSAFADIIARQRLPQSWVVSIFDSKGVNVGRVPNSEQFVGRQASPSLFPILMSKSEGITETTSLEGIPLMTAFSRGEAFGWSAAIGIPRAELVNPVFEAEATTFVIGGILSLISLALAQLVAGQISRPIAALRRLATAPDRPGLQGFARTGLPETDEVAEALWRAVEDRRRSEEERLRASKALSEIEEKLRQSQKMEAIGNLTGGLAHDFNNLLGVIVANLDLARAELRHERDVAGLLDEAVDAALRGGDLIRHLLAFARQQPLSPQRVDLNGLISGMVTILRRTLGDNIEIALELAGDLWPTVVDPVQLQSSLVNLATNARDAMPNGGRLLIVARNDSLDADYAAVHPEVVPGDYAVIEVSDTGTGMPPEVLRRVFDPFYTTKGVGKGTGLGLSMVFGFIKQSGGHINIYSEVGKGTTIRLYLPRDLRAAAPVAVAARPSRPVGGFETILIVEDNAAFRKVSVRQIKALGYRVLEAEGPAAALKQLEHEKVDLLFTDLMMPGGVDGFALAKEARARWPNLKVMLASGFPETKLAGSEAVRHILAKPWRVEELSRKLRETLDQP